MTVYASDVLRTHLVRVLACIEAHWDAQNAFLVIRPRVRYIDRWKELIRDHLARRCPYRAAEPDFAVAAEGVSAAILAMYRYWLSHPSDVQAGDIANAAARIVGSLAGLAGVKTKNKYNRPENVVVR